MSDDPVYTAFLESAAEDAAASIAASDILSLRLRPGAGAAADTYDGWLVGVEHLERAALGTARVSDAPVLFTVHFPRDYCRSTDPKLQFRVASVRTPLWHPNALGGILCLGPYFRPATRLRPLLEQIHGIVSGRIRATDDAFDKEAAHYYLVHLDQVRALRARPLWRRPVVGGGYLERLGGAS
jgi:hypothetical protein